MPNEHRHESTYTVFSGYHGVVAFRFELKKHAFYNFCTNYAKSGNSNVPLVNRCTSINTYK